MAGILIKLTTAGRAALVSPGNTGTAKRLVVSIGVATAAFTHKDDLAKLPNERKRLQTIAGVNVAPDTIHVTIQDDTDDRYTMFGFGLYLDNGVLLGTVSSAVAIAEKAPAAIMLVAADIKFETADATLLVFGDASFANPPATEERMGIIELATAEETGAGEDDSRAVTPQKLRHRLAALGLGTTDNSASIADLNDVSVGSGMFFATADAKNLPMPRGAGMVLHRVYGTSGMQIFSPLEHSRLFFRRRIDQEWQSWSELAPTDSPRLTGSPTAPTPPTGDHSTRIATTAFVMDVISTTSIGQIIIEARTSVRAGWLKLNGAVLKRADYPLLWAYAQSSGALVPELEWFARGWGCFSTGDGITTFRIPDGRGEYLRFWDDGRGADIGREIGSYQGPQNMTHSHTASATTVGDHLHSAWTDAQGSHNHGGPTTAAGAHNHHSGIYRNSMIYGGGGPRDDIGEYPTDPIYTSSAGDHQHWIHWDGQHGHNVGIGGGGSHTHGVTIESHGGDEVRVRSIAFLAMIRAY